MFPYFGYSMKFWIKVGSGRTDAIYISEWLPKSVY